MQTLPLIQTSIQDLSLLQTRWRSILNALIGLPQLNSSIVANVQLKAGSNSVNTGLQQALQGWSIVRQRGPATIYDLQDSNQTPNLTLTLVSSAAVSVDILVF
jgi:hypothetical protein